MKKCLFLYAALLVVPVSASDVVKHESAYQQPIVDQEVKRKTEKWNEMALLPWKPGSGMVWKDTSRVCTNVAIYDSETQTLKMGTNTVRDILPEDVQMVECVVKDVAAVVAATQKYGGKPGWV